MTNDWIKELSSEYIALREKSIGGSWVSWGNIRKRFAFFSKARNTAYLELKEYDYDFSYEIENWLKLKLNQLELEQQELEKGIRALKQHISRAGERWGFLVSFASVYAIAVLFIKGGIIPYPTLSLVSFSLLALLVLEERTKHLNSKHALEELVVYLEAAVDEKST
jgi:hypothetical protein